MNVTYAQVDKAENISSRLEEAIYYMKSAAEELENVSDGSCADYVAALRDLIFSAETEKESYDEILVEADHRETIALNRAYERSVL